MTIRMRKQSDLCAAGRQRRKMRRLLGEHLECVVLEIPAAVAPDTDWNYLVAFRIHRRHHSQRGAQRNFMLAGTSSEQDADSESFFFSHLRSPRRVACDGEDSDMPRARVRAAQKSIARKSSGGKTLDDSSAVLL